MSTRFPSRACPICGCGDKTVLFRQTFAALSSGSLLDGFDLVVCSKCGGAYADDIPAQEAFDRYYTEMSKYEYAANAGETSPSDQARFKEIVDLVSPYLKSDDRILDIGCATGGLLAVLKARGYAHVLGVDPSPQCARLCEQLHGIRARALKISNLNELNETAAVVFLTGVLEHLRDVEGSMAHVSATVAAGGKLYIEVPDASRYDQHFSAPYQLLSMEHVNYLSPLSLTALMARHGYRPLVVKRVKRYLTGGQAIEPCVGGLFERMSGPATAELPYDNETRPSLDRYLVQSAKLEQQINERIDALVEARVPLAVWGVGTHTLRLLKTSRLGDANIIAFIDSNVNYQHKRLNGIPVVAPGEFADRSIHIMISSQVSEDDIYRTITDRLRWTNPVHRLYSDSDS
jgi:SAM-dependent methyltransferase